MALKEINLFWEKLQESNLQMTDGYGILQSDLKFQIFKAGLFIRFYTSESSTESTATSDNILKLYY